MRQRDAADRPQGDPHGGSVLAIVDERASGNTAIEPIWTLQRYPVGTSIDNLNLASRQSVVNGRSGDTHQATFAPPDHHERLTAKP